MGNSDKKCFASYLQVFRCGTRQNSAKLFKMKNVHHDGERPEIPLFIGVSAERGGFEPPNRFRRLHAFQACTLILYLFVFQEVTK